MHGIIIDYLYRDSGNNKRHSSKSFFNPTQVAISTISSAFHTAFLCQQLFPDVLSFDPAAIGWETLFFADHDEAANDINLHEIDKISVGEISVHDADTIDDLLNRLQSLSIPAISAPR